MENFRDGLIKAVVNAVLFLLSMYLIFVFIIGIRDIIKHDQYKDIDFGSNKEYKEQLLFGSLTYKENEDLLLGIKEDLNTIEELRKEVQELKDTPVVGRVTTMDKELDALLQTQNERLEAKLKIANDLNKDNYLILDTVVDVYSLNYSTKDLILNQLLLKDNYTNEEKQVLRAIGVTGSLLYYKNYSPFRSSLIYVIGCIIYIPLLFIKYALDQADNKNIDDDDEDAAKDETNTATKTDTQKEE